MKLFYSPSYVAAGHDFDTTRKAKWVADSLAETPITGVNLLAPSTHTPEIVESLLDGIHSAEYIHAVKTGEPNPLAQSQGFRWDPQLWHAVLASNAGIAEAVTLALVQGQNTGSLSSGLHHANRNSGKGFCTFNGLALGAKLALGGMANFKGDADKVLIIDLDAHCGGGTHDILKNEERIWHLDIATDSYDRYEHGSRWTLDRIRLAEKYLPTLQLRLKEFERHKFGLCIYNAGMDPFERCQVGGLRGITKDLIAEREATVFDWCKHQGIPVSFVLAGGYIGPDFKETELVELHRLTIKAACA